MKTKRAVSDVPIFLDNRLWKELYGILELEGWDYKTNKADFQLRDRTLISLLILTGCRISEALNLTKSQFRVYDDRIVLGNVKTKKKNLLRDKIIMPKRGHFEPFTSKVEEWLKKVPSDESFVFPHGLSFFEPKDHSCFDWKRPMSTKRAFWIIKTTTGKFPHWFRGVCENIYGRIVFKNSAWKLKEFMGYRSIESTTSYVSSSWEEDEKRIYTV
jgi:integrase